jgi:hypothetical protein
MQLGVTIEFGPSLIFSKTSRYFNLIPKGFNNFCLPWILIKIWILIWESCNNKGCSPCQILSPNIFISIFWAQEGHFWSNQVWIEIELVWIDLNFPGGTHLSICPSPPISSPPLFLSHVCRVSDDTHHRPPPLAAHSVPLWLPSPLTPHNPLPSSLSVCGNEPRLEEPTQALLLVIAIAVDRSPPPPHHYATSTLQPSNKKGAH